MSRTRIESLGTYLPARTRSSDEVVASLAHVIDLPLERWTGIRGRRVADHETAHDLALRAGARCLERSRYAIEDVDLVICASISRFSDASGNVEIEPAASIRLAVALGARAETLVFDVVNACAGMFTAIWVADAMLATGAIRTALIVSGEHLSPLVATAEREIESARDPRIACLTLGDAGAAVLLDREGADGAGLHALDLYTLSRHAGLCVARPSERSAGPIMITDAIRMGAVGQQPAARHALSTLASAGWAPEDVDLLVPHQTSRTTIRDAVRAIERLLGTSIDAETRVLDVLEERGNTASAAHFGALDEALAAGRLCGGEKVVFAITASGMVIGTMLYQLDDLPTRGRVERRAPLPAVRREERAVRITACGVAACEGDTLVMARDAVERCLDAAEATAASIDVLIFVGTYRTSFVFEPAIAAMLARELGMNASATWDAPERTLAFDVGCGSAGALAGLAVARAAIAGGKARRVLVVGSEVEHGGRGLAPGASAMLLEAARAGERALGPIRFALDAAGAGPYAVRGRIEIGGGHLAITPDPELDERFIRHAAQLARAECDAAGLRPTDLVGIVAPQSSPGFIARLADALEVPRALVVDATRPAGDRGTTGLAAALARAPLSGPLLVVETGVGLYGGATLLRAHD